jgi:hypothetical protein
MSQLSESGSEFYHKLSADPMGSIRFLGTACAIPSKYRNVSGIFVETGSGALLLDAGEGSWHQLLRLISAEDRGSGVHDKIYSLFQYYFVLIHF